MGGSSSKPETLARPRPSSQTHHSLSTNSTAAWNPNVHNHYDQSNVNRDVRGSVGVTIQRNLSGTQQLPVAPVPATRRIAPQPPLQQKTNPFVAPDLIPMQLSSLQSSTNTTSNHVAPVRVSVQPATPKPPEPTEAHLKALANVTYWTLTGEVPPKKQTTMAATTSLQKSPMTSFDYVQRHAKENGLGSPKPAVKRLQNSPASVGRPPRKSEENPPTGAGRLNPGKMPPLYKGKLLF